VQPAPLPPLTGGVFLQRRPDALAQARHADRFGQIYVDFGDSQRENLIVRVGIG